MSNKEFWKEHSKKLARLTVAVLAIAFAEVNAIESENKNNVAYSDLKKLAKQLGQKRPDHQYQTTLFGKPLSIGGEIANNLKYKKDFELTDNANDDEVVLSGKMELEFYLQWAPTIALLIEPIWSYERDLYAEDNKRTNENSFRRGQTWIYFDRIANSNLGLQIGRQELRENREWWWDKDLDAVRLHYHNNDISAEIAVVKELAKVSSDDDGIDPDKKNVVWVLGKLSWQWTKKQTLAIFFTHKNDQSDSFLDNQIIDEKNEDESDANLTWIGFRAMGKEKIGAMGKLYYWLDLAHVDGKEEIIDFDNFGDNTRIVDDIDTFDVEGWAIDFGATLQTKLKGKPRLTLGYAKGSGDSDFKDKNDTSFQQTGLHVNDGKFRGVNRFRYYGELLRPELSNLEITTLAIGFPFFKKSSAEFIYHHYAQVNAVDFIRDDSLHDRPNGKSKNIGQEIDLIIGIEESVKWEWELVASIFKAGNALGKNANELAYKFSLSLDYNF